MVGVRGFEPPASASRTQRSSQTEPHPDIIGEQNFCSCFIIYHPFLLLQAVTCENISFFQTIAKLFTSDSNCVKNPTALLFAIICRQGYIMNQ